ncbi:PREDICTED: signal recognition particle receptor subunit alpha isoform X2 [Lipotes vexillifer]|uniref:Signal recognition particle receptor subunit alpha isoform X2 n=2 Tax=Odontoceti TaxID=9722 RepID=A0A340XQS4_LIPVE|nr:signal recognition particle receptor subunit alpha isoform X4 [Tursiops truncatus]XP_007463681.1 PREDICTED: signal recognition particle receptor subunit alpha isoform X2 [Lipotes vexillifer]XP_030696625.1 signal recognition particle receptor subunit alpha isoform X4 [Globicephala melas]
MLDFFTIFSKGGLVLWCFQGVSDSCTGPVNALIRSVLLQVGFQKILTLTYVDKLIDDVHRLFRDKYRTEIQQQSALSLLNGTFDFQNDFLRLLREAEESSKVRAPTTMKKFEDSEKAKKPVRSMIETRGEKPKEKAKNSKKNKGAKKEGSDGPLATSKAVPAEKSGLPVGPENGIELSKEELIRRKREEFIQKHGRGMEKSSKSSKSDAPKEKGKKAPRVWALGGSVNKEVLDYSAPTANGAPEGAPPEDINLIRGTGSGRQLQDLDCSSSDDEGAAQNSTKPSATKGTLGGMFGMLKGLVGSKSLSREDMESVLDKMRDHLIAKNVAADIAVQLCESVANKLEGKVMGTFSTVTSTVKLALQESLVQILQPQRRVDMLRDIMDAQRHQRPYVVTFCGVNGVGKSTNLAKISFWLLENGFSVLIAACDTFRAGAVEQLRTHTRRLRALHPPENHGGRAMVQLFEKGYGKDAAGIAMEAIAFARNQGFDVVLVDTAGRMQDNAPLMTALAKLITVNTPDLVLFVGEALVGNEAVDQLVKFNRALADHSMAQTPRLIDGIVLTKFDTIDDKVGAAISMTYITSKPIVFVGTGQTYCDLRSLNAKAVVAALMKA